MWQGSVAIGGEYFLKTAVFDLDGTLVDTSRDMLAAANRVFETRGYAPPLHHPKHAEVGVMGGRKMLELGAKISGHVWDDYAAAYQEFLGVYAQNLHEASVIYPGVEACLDRLDRAGWKLAVCTNKPEALAERLLVSLGLRSKFCALIGPDTLPTRKPDPEPLLEAIRRAGGSVGQSVMIGDTNTDRNTARNAGVPCVLVTFGPNGDALHDLEPEGLLADYDQLDALLERLV